MDNFITVRIINIGIVSSIRRIVISWFFFTTFCICTFISSIGLTHWDIDWITWLIQSHSFTSKVLAKICIDTFQIHHHVTLLSGCTEMFMQISNLSSKQPSWNLKWWIHEKSMPPSHGHRCEASLKPPGQCAVVPCQRPQETEMTLRPPALKDQACKWKLCTPSQPSSHNHGMRKSSIRPLHLQPSAMQSLSRRTRLELRLLALSCILSTVWTLPT